MRIIIIPRQILRQTLQNLDLFNDQLGVVRTFKTVIALTALASVLTGCKDTGNTVAGWRTDTFNRSSLATPNVSLSLVEGNSMTILVTLDNPIKEDADLSWKMDAPVGVARSLSGIVHFAKGESSGALQIDTMNNSVRDGTHTYPVTLSGAFTVFTNSLTLDLTIIDDESPPVLSIANASVTEGTGAGTSTMNFTVTVSYTSVSDITVNYGNANGTATAGLDYTPTTGTLTIPAGSLTGTISVPIIHDALTESSETFNITLSGGAAYTVAGSTLSALGTILDDDGTPTISIADVSIAEGNGAGTTTATLTILASGLSSTPITVDYATLMTGTATVGTDFTSTMGTATIAAGATSTTFTIPITRDSLKESNETINVELSGGNGYQSFGSTLNSVVTITDDDAAPTISIANVSLNEGISGSSNMVFTVTASTASGLPVSVNYATSNGTAIAGTDYTATSGTATIAAGSTTTTISVPILGNALYENDETLTLTLSGGSGYTTAGSTLSATGTITNDDTAPTISIANVSLAEGISSTGTMTFTVTSSSTSNLPISFNYATSNGTATAGSDYVAASGSATIAVGATTTTIDVTVNGDTLYEGSETLTMNLSGGSGYTVAGSTLTATGTITNDDTGPTISIAEVSQAEGNSGSSNMVFTVTASTASGLPITVNYATSNGTATAASDYTATSGTATIAAGSTTATISVPVLGDKTYENDETFSLTLSSVSGYTKAGSILSTTGTITNDDTAPTISIANSSVSEDNSGNSTMTFTVTASSASGLPISFNYATSAVTATAVSDYTAVNTTGAISAGLTSTTFTVSVNGDALYENDETFTVTLSGGSGYTSAGSTLSATGTITNDDTAPTISIGNTSITEGTGAGTTSAIFTIIASTISGADITVDHATSNGTATAGSDYTTTSATATIAAGSTTTTFTVPILRDGTYESPEIYNVTLSGGAGYTTAGSTLTATGTVLDDDLMSLTWDFATPANYTYDTNYITMSGTTASLKAVNTTFNDVTTFNSGTHVGTHFSDGVLRPLISNNSSLRVDQILPAQATNLAGYWRFDNSLSDEKGFWSCKGQNSPSFNSDRIIGTHSLLVSTNQAASCGAGPLLTNFSISLWFKPSVAPSGVWALLGRFQNNPWRHNYYLNIRDGKLEFGFHNGSIWPAITGTKSAWIPGTWYHIVATYTGGTGVLYVNGVVDPTSTGSLTGTPYTAGSDILSIGGNVAENKSYSSGQFDEVALFNSAITGADVGTLYSAQAQKFADKTELSPSWTPKWSSLVGYWKMDGNWLDSSGKGNTASPQNGASLSNIAKVGNQAGSFVSASYRFASIANSATLENIQEASFSQQVWYNPAALPENTNNSNSSHCLICKQGFHTGIRYLPDGRFEFVVYTSTNAKLFIRSDASYPPGQYHHVIGVQDLVKNELRLYVNGSEKITPLVGFTCREFATQVWRIGSGASDVTTSGSSWFANGLIDDAALWNSALSSSDASLIYNRQKQKYAGSYDSLVIDLGASGVWTNLLSRGTLPFGKPLAVINESSSEYLYVDTTLSDQLVGYWPLEGAQTDRSGQHQPILYSGLVSYQRGNIGKGILLSATGARAAIPPYPTTTLDDAMTSSFWLKANPADFQTTKHILKRDDYGSGGWTVRRSGSGIQLSVITTNGSATTVNLAAPGVTFDDGRWHHIAFSINKNIASPSNSTAKLYFDGRLLVTAPYDHQNGFGNSEVIYLSDWMEGGSYDELSFWNRALDDSAILQLYRRGANRLKYQVHTCVDATCACRSYNTTPAGSASDCDGDGVLNAADTSDTFAANWIGPDGTASTYFSELQNNSRVDASGNPVGTVNTTFLKLDWSGSFFTSAARPSANRYFQYRVYMESDDENNLCSGAPCMPEVTSIDVGPVNRYYGGSPTIVNNSAQSYSSLQTMTRSDTGSCTTYQVSTDSGSTWKYWTGSAWSTATAPSHVNYLSDYAGNLSALSSGNFKFKAFLNTNTSGDFTQSCTLNSVGITYAP